MLKLHFKDSRQVPLWLVDEQLTFGRDSSNHVVLDDVSVARRHALIEKEAEQYYIRVCDSGYSTFVNDERVLKRYQLRAGDCVRIGQTELLLEDPSKAQAPALLGQRWFLQVLKGEHEGKKFHVSASLTCGRSSHCELCFTDAALSRRHCEFFLKNGVLQVKDLASANGVLVNDEKKTAAALKPGDQVRLGSITLLVIGPRQDQLDAELDPDDNEDATLFVRAVDLPKPVTTPRPRPVIGSATVNPLHAAAQVQAQPESERKRAWFLLTGLMIGLLAAAGAYQFWFY